MKDSPFANMRSRIGTRLFGGASGDVFRGMASLALGAGTAQLVGIAAIPILTRLYSPEDFGVLAVFSTLVAVLVPLVTLRYVVALPLPHHDGMAMNLLALSCLLMLGFSALVGLILSTFGAPLLALVSMEALAPWWGLVVLGVLGAATHESLTLWATRRRAYNVIAHTDVTRSLAGTASKIAFGLATLQPLGLLAGQVVSQFSGNGRMLRSFRAEFCANWPHIRLSRIQQVAWRYRSFPLWRVPSQFLLAFSSQGPVLFVAGMFGAQSAGQFGLAITLLSTPLNIVGQSVGRALYGEACAAMKTAPERVPSLASGVQRKLFFMALFPALLLFFFGERLFIIALGSEWAMAGTFASTLSFASVIQLSSAPMVQLLNLLPSQTTFLLINSARIAGTLTIFWSASALSLDERTTVLTYSIFTGTFYTVTSLIISEKLRSMGQHSWRN